MKQTTSCNVMSQPLFIGLLDEVKNLLTHTHTRRRNDDVKNETKNNVPIVEQSSAEDGVVVGSGVDSTGGSEGDGVGSAGVSVGAGTGSEPESSQPHGDWTNGNTNKHCAGEINPILADSSSSEQVNSPCAGILTTPSGIVTSRPSPQIEHTNKSGLVGAAVSSASTGAAVGKSPISS